MKNELQNKIIEKFPELFDINKDIERGEPFFPIAFGLECGDGWYHLIYNLCDQITSHLKWINEKNEEKEELKITQIKEKFGFLNFNVTSASEYIRGLIRNTEALSFYVCEKCGSFDNGRTHGRWVYNCCKKCYDEKIERKDGLIWENIDDYENRMEKWRKGESEK